VANVPNVPIVPQINTSARSVLEEALMITHVNLAQDVLLLKFFLFLARDPQPAIFTLVVIAIFPVTA